MHTRTARQSYPAYDPVHLLGTLRRRDEAGRYVVQCDGHDWTVARAASCLLAPEVGDTVLISGPDPERVYLIAVIEQADPSQGAVELDGALLLRSRQAGVTVQAAEDVRIEGRRSVQVQTQMLSLRAERAESTVGSLQYVADEVQGLVGTTRLVGRAYEAVLDSLSYLSRVAFRTASEVEHVRAGTLDYQAEQSARVHAPYTMVTADALVKVDAKQVHMG
jgi:hypothetical protein